MIGRITGAVVLLFGMGASVLRADEPRPAPALRVEAVAPEAAPAPQPDAPPGVQAEAWRQALAAYGGLIQGGLGAPAMMMSATAGGAPLPPGVKMEMVKAAYLGVATRPASPEVRAQLDLPDGVGLAVEFVDPEGPAKEAGVQRHDVLHKLNDQILINQHQFAVLVRTFKPGDEVTLTVIRKAKPRKIAATLVEKEQPKMLPGGGLFYAQAAAAPLPMGPDALRKMFKPGGPAAAGMTVGQMTISDGQRQVTLTIDANGGRRLKATDKAGKVIYDGPIDTPEQRAKVPADILKLVDTMKIVPAPVPPGVGGSPGTRR